jgi:predicted GTPase
LKRGGNYKSRGKRKRKDPLRELARDYLLELESNYLEVVLIPSRDHDCAMRGGMIRAVQYQNADWYRMFCSEHESQRKDRHKWRKFKTKIKRQWTRRALRELIAGKCETHYAQMLREFIVRYQADRQDVAA